MSKFASIRKLYCVAVCALLSDVLEVLTIEEVILLELILKWGCDVSEQVQYSKKLRSAVILL